MEAEDKLLSLGYIDTSRQSLAQFLHEMKNPSYNVYNLLHYLRKARLCIEVVEKILSENEPEGGDKDGG